MIKFTTIVMMVFLSCNSRVGIDNKSSDERTSRGKSDFGIMEVYRIPDEETLQFLRNVKPILGFTPIFELNMDVYQLNIMGIADKNKDKPHILKEIIETDSLSEEAKLAWSRYKVENRQTGKTAYNLYMLKKGTADYLSSKDIKFLEYGKDPFSENLIISGEFNEVGTAKWIKLTNYAYEDDNAFVAFLVNGEVYSCPYIAAPVESGNFSFIVKSEEEAKTIIESLNTNSR